MTSQDELSYLLCEFQNETKRDDSGDETKPLKILWSEWVDTLGLSIAYCIVNKVKLPARYNDRIVPRSDFNRKKDKTLVLTKSVAIILDVDTDWVELNVRMHCLLSTGHLRIDKELRKAVARKSGETQPNHSQKQKDGKTKVKNSEVKTTYPNKKRKWSSSPARLSRQNTSEAEDMEHVLIVKESTKNVSEECFLDHPLSTLRPDEINDGEDNFLVKQLPTRKRKRLYQKTVQEHGDFMDSETDSDSGDPSKMSKTAAIEKIKKLKLSKKKLKAKLREALVLKSLADVCVEVNKKLVLIPSALDGYGEMMEQWKLLRMSSCSCKHNAADMMEVDHSTREKKRPPVQPVSSMETINADPAHEVFPSSWSNSETFADSGRASPVSTNSTNFSSSSHPSNNLCSVSTSIISKTALSFPMQSFPIITSISNSSDPCSQHPSHSLSISSPSSLSIPFPRSPPPSGSSNMESPQSSVLVKPSPAPSQKTSKMSRTPKTPKTGKESKHQRAAPVYKEEEVFQFGSTTLTGRQLSKCNHTGRLSSLANDLCTLLYTDKELALSSLTGSVPNGHTTFLAKERLDSVRLQAIIDYMVKFLKEDPDYVSSEVRKAIAIKINNFCKTPKGRQIQEECGQKREKRKEEFVLDL